MRVLHVLVLAGSWIMIWRTLPPDPPRARPSLNELVAMRWLNAHDMAIQRYAEAKRRCAERNALRPRAFGVLYGLGRATPGPAFGETVVGGSVGRASDDPYPIDGTYRAAGTDFVEVMARVASGREQTCWAEDDPKVFCPFECTDDQQADCDALAAQLDKAWGDSPNDVWIDRSGTVRASVRLATDCELRFQRYVPPHRWIGNNLTAAVPLALIGRSVNDLPYFTDDRGNGHSWSLAVTGEHMLRAHMHATANDAGRIVSLYVRGEIDVHGGADELHELVRRYAGGSLNVTLSTDEGRFELDVSRR